MNELMFDYLLEMGQLDPMEEQLLRKQKQLEALRGGAMEAPQGQMVGKHYVAPSWTQYAAQLGKGYMAGQGQKQVDAQMGALSEKQRAVLERLKRERAMKAMGNTSSLPRVMDTTDYGGGL